MAKPFPLTRRQALAGTAAGAALAALRANAQADPLVALGVAEASRRIAARELSPVALTETYLARIERIDPAVNAYITVTAASALAEARSAEREIAAGRRLGPLHGVPLALKDNIDTAGVLTTAASAHFADRVPAEDAEVVRKLKAAGAVLLGKLNMHEFAYGGSTAATHYGPTHNPWDLAFIPGGSSGGSAAAVAAGLCAGALGTDTAASVRVPAAFCGVVGLKATYGLASIRGIVPLSETMDHVGPITRSVEDAALMLNAIVGYDPRDVSSIRSEAEDFTAAIGRDVSRLRLGVPRIPFFEEVDADILTAVEQALRTLGGLTASTRDTTLPDIQADMLTVTIADAYAYHAGRVATEAGRAVFDPLVLGRILDGAAVTAPDYIAARRRVEIARRTIVESFADIDVLVLPTTQIPPYTVEQALTAPPDDFGLIRNTLPFNAFGIPAISLPCGFTASGLPIGLMLAGAPRREADVLALAHAFERATPWHERAPRIA